MASDDDDYAASAPWARGIWPPRQMRSVYFILLFWLSTVSVTMLYLGSQLNTTYVTHPPKYMRLNTTYVTHPPESQAVLATKAIQNNWNKGFELFHFILFYENIPSSSYCTVESLYHVLQVAGSSNKTKIILWTKNESFHDNIRFLLGAVVCKAMDEPCETALGSNVVLINSNFDSIIKDTPFVQLFSFPQQKPLGIFANQNKANAMRLALVYKYGGCYSDVDFIFFGGDPAKMRRGAGEEEKGIINNAMFKFDAREPVVKYLMQEFVDGYNGDKWGHQGPRLFTRVFTGSLQGKSHCSLESNSKIVTCTGGQKPFNITTRNKVFPIHYNDIISWAQKQTLYHFHPHFHVSDTFIENSDALHTWNKIIAKWESNMIHFKISKYLKSNLALLRKRQCPVTLSIMIQRTRQSSVAVPPSKSTRKALADFLPPGR